MAIHTELPIYKVAYDLLDAITDLARNMPRDFKQSIGGKLGVDVNGIQEQMTREAVIVEQAAPAAGKGGKKAKKGGAE